MQWSSNGRPWVISGQQAHNIWPQSIKLVPNKMLSETIGALSQHMGRFSTDNGTVAGTPVVKEGMIIFRQQAQVQVHCLVGFVFFPDPGLMQLGFLWSCLPAEVGVSCRCFNNWNIFLLICTYIKVKWKQKLYFKNTLLLGLSFRHCFSTQSTKALLLVIYLRLCYNYYSFFLFSYFLFQSKVTSQSKLVSLKKTGALFNGIEKQKGMANTICLCHNHQKGCPHTVWLETCWSFNVFWWHLL